MSDLALSCAVAILIVLGANTYALARMAVHMRDRNLKLTENTRELTANQMTLDGIWETLIALYPDHDQPERPSNAARLFAVQKRIKTQRAIAEFRAQSNGELSPAVNE